jgi:hypothetical protein
MSTFSFTYSGRPTRQSPRMGTRVAESRKRFQCNLFEFWRQCSSARCRRNHGCAGNPHDCFSENHAAMPDDHAAWRCAEILSRTTGTGSVERTLRAVGLSLPADLHSGHAGPSLPCQADADGRDVPGQEGKASSSARKVAEVLSRWSPESIAKLKQQILAPGISLKNEPGPERTSPPQCQADEKARVVVPEYQSPASAERARAVSKGMDFNDVMARLRALGANV